MSTYEYLTGFVASFGAIYFSVIFAGVLAYTFWPSKKQVFGEAAHMPLRED